MTQTEELIFRLCNKTFLSLWSFPNPIGKEDKELCDVLVVCEPDIIIFSIKDINICDSGNSETDFNRWNKRAIDDSVKQLYGAERFIMSHDGFTLCNHRTQVEFPDVNHRKVYRIAVCFGIGERFSLKYGDFGKGFIHVFDEKSFQIVLKELDTIKDFIDYLKSKEAFILAQRYLFSYGEEDTLAYYLSNNFAFPDAGDLVIFEGDLYEGLRMNPKYQKILSELKTSYVWDNLIRELIEDFDSKSLITNVPREDLERTLRQIAREDRNSRKVLSDQFLDFIGYKKEPLARARVIVSGQNSEVIYLFLLVDYSQRDLRVEELQMRSFVLRAIYNCKTIVGIATERYNPRGHSLDFSFSSYPEFSEEQKNDAIKLAKDLGYFMNLINKEHVCPLKVMDTHDVS